MSIRVLVLAVLGAAAIAAAPLASAAPAPPDPFGTFKYSQNMHPLGFSDRANSPEPNFTANSDLAFWGKTAYQGNYDGFRIIDVTEPDNPVELSDYPPQHGLLLVERLEA